MVIICHKKEILHLDGNISSTEKFVNIIHQDELPECFYLSIGKKNFNSNGKESSITSIAIDLNSDELRSLAVHLHALADGKINTKDYV